MEKRVVFYYVKKNIKQVLISLFALTLVFSSAFLTMINTFSFLETNQTISCSTNFNETVGSNLLDKLKEIVGQFFYKGQNKNKKTDNRKIEVYAGGYPLGFTMECEGVIIVALGEVQTDKGTIKPVYGKDIKVGDVLYSIGGEIITNANQLHTLVNDSGGEKIDCLFKRGEKEFSCQIKPELEQSTQVYRLGLWIRDNGAGVGTLTFIRKDNNRFGALGHPVCDIDTGRKMPVYKGNIYKCNIVGYNKGTRGNPGELRGLFLKTGIVAGTLDKNTEFGVYGTVAKTYTNSLSKLMEVGFKDSVKTGPAKILCTIDGNEPKEYDIEIVKLSYQTKSDKKSMVIRVTDKKLIASTGGIVQGMSGSPIIQNGKLIGAVTHVFISDPTKGFGLYIDWMIDN